MTGGSTTPTPILDFGSPIVEEFVSLLDDLGDMVPRDKVVVFHGLIARETVAVYGLEETQPVSTTIANRRGSCSQRLAVLEALARRAGIATCVEGIVVAGSFWYPRFPYMRPFLPREVVIAWPSFPLDDEWVDVSAVIHRTDDDTFCVFENRGEATLFDALPSAPISWSAATSDAPCNDFSAFVLRSLGIFDSRDQLFEAHGQTFGFASRRAISLCSGHVGANGRYVA